MRLGLWAAFLAGGCFSVPARDCTLACGDGEQCPSGLHCVQGMCRDDGLDQACGTPDAAVGMDGAADSPPAPSSCGSTTLITDDFNDGIIDGYTTSVESGALVTEENGHLRLIPGSLENGVASVLSELRYDLRGSAIYVQVPLVALGDTFVGSFGLWYDPEHAAVFGLSGVNLSCGSLIDGTANLTSVPYQPEAHRWWRLREQTGTLFCEVSSDGASWSEVHQTAMPATFDLGKVFFAAQHVGASTNGLIEFDNLNGGGTPLGRFCPLTGVADDFADDQPGRRFEIYKTGGVSSACGVAEAGGSLLVTPSTTSADGCGYVSSLAYDATGAAVWARVSEVAGGGAYTVLALDDGVLEQDSIFIAASMGVLVAGGYTGGAMQVETGSTYDGAAHAYWRLREAGGRIFFETSPNNSSWTIELERDAPPWITRARVRLGAGSFSGTGAGQAKFEEVRGVTP